MTTFSPALMLHYGGKPGDATHCSGGCKVSSLYLADYRPLSSQRCEPPLFLRSARRGRFQTSEVQCFGVLAVIELCRFTTHAAGLFFPAEVLVTVFLAWRYCRQLQRER